MCERAIKWDWVGDVLVLVFVGHTAHQIWLGALNPSSYCEDGCSALYGDSSIYVYYFWEKIFLWATT